MNIEHKDDKWETMTVLVAGALSGFGDAVANNKLSPEKAAHKAVLMAAGFSGLWWIVRVELATGAVAEVASSDGVLSGESVAVIGNPYGHTPTVAAGVLAALEVDERVRVAAWIHAGLEGGALSVAWSPDGSTLVAGCGGSQIVVWRPGSGKAVEILTGHDQRVDAVAFSPDGERIVSGSFDSSLRLWNARTLTPLISLRGHEGPVKGVCFSADSKRIYSVSFDNTLRVWEAP